ncbi:MAG: hypothetical protein JW705_07215 [Methanosarcinaceae archaeon]|nr:hypothetical protein [Methanosarcinaceae archaeon]
MAVTTSMTSPAVPGKVSYETPAVTSVIAGTISTLWEPAHMKIIGADGPFSKRYIISSLSQFGVLFLF